MPLSTPKIPHLSVRFQTSALRIHRLTVRAVAVSKRYDIPIDRNLDRAETLKCLLYFSFI